MLTGSGVTPVARRVSLSMAKGAIGFTFEGPCALGVRSEPPLTARMAAVMLGRSHYFSHARAAMILATCPGVDRGGGCRALSKRPGSDARVRHGRILTPPTGTTNIAPVMFQS